MKTFLLVLVILITIYCTYKLLYKEKLTQHFTGITKRIKKDKHRENIDLLEMKKIELEKKREVLKAKQLKFEAENDSVYGTVSENNKIQDDIIEINNKIQEVEEKITESKNDIRYSNMYENFNDLSNQEKLEISMVSGYNPSEYDIIQQTPDRTGWDDLRGRPTALIKLINEKKDIEQPLPPIQDHSISEVIKLQGRGI